MTDSEATEWMGDGRALAEASDEDLRRELARRVEGRMKAAIAALDALEEGQVRDALAACRHEIKLSAPRGF